MKYSIHVIIAFFLLPASGFAQFLFQDVTGESGIYMYGSGSNEAGSGVVVADFDNDGWDDFYLPGGQDSDKIFINQRDGTFKQVAPLNLMSHLDRHDVLWKTYPRGGIVFDFDNDDLPDLYSGGENNDILWHNKGNFVFSDVTDSAHLRTSLNQNETMSATFGDFDGDGYNDFYVGRWYNGVCIFSGDSGTYATGDCHGFLNWFYVNNHDGTFNERAKEFEIDCDTTKVTNIVLFFDYDRDGDLDLLIGNDNGKYMQPNRVFKNMLVESGIAYFDDATMATGLATQLSCMGIGPCDYNHDGHFDFFETTFGPDYLMSNDSHEVFTNVRQNNLPYLDGHESTGPFITTSWTALMADYDNDGWEDGFIVHGALQPFVSISAFEYTNPNKYDTSVFFHNVSGVFQDVTDKALGGKYLSARGRGAGYLDFNHDGKLDIVYGSLSTKPDPEFKNSSFRLLKNINTPSEITPHWIEMRFTAKRTAKEAIGTIVDVWAGGILHTRQVSTGGGFGSQNSLMQHVGLGTESKADSIIIYWPCDQHLHRQIDRYHNVKADTILNFVERMSDGVLLQQDPQNEPIKLYPLPATSVLHIINLKSAILKRIQICDLLGRTLAEIFCVDNNCSIPVAKLLPGHYFLRITTDGLVESSQFIKK
jgi:hypothetical protein